jgi:hypothetical protein
MVYLRFVSVSIHLMVLGHVLAGPVTVTNTTKVTLEQLHNASTIQLFSNVTKREQNPNSPDSPYYYLTKVGIASTSRWSPGLRIDPQ